jgi:hypothetical protein
MAHCRLYLNKGRQPEEFDAVQKNALGSAFKPMIQLVNAVL